MARLITRISLATLVVVTAAFTLPAAKWPPWISIESPVNPFDPATHGAAMLVHAHFREGPTQLADLSGSAEGMVRGARRSIPLRFDATPLPNVYALRRQWPSGGAWVLKINLRTTTAIVSLDDTGAVAAVQIPTQVAADGSRVPRAVSSREVDSTLMAMTAR
jgi:hypothetical protein